MPGLNDQGLPYGMIQNKLKEKGAAPYSGKSKRRTV